MRRSTVAPREWRRRCSAGVSLLHTQLPGRSWATRWTWIRRACASSVGCTESRYSQSVPASSSTSTSAIAGGGRCWRSPIPKWASTSRAGSSAIRQDWRLTCCRRMSCRCLERSHRKTSPGNLPGCGRPRRRCLKRVGSGCSWIHTVSRQPPGADGTRCPLRPEHRRGGCRRSMFLDRSAPTLPAPDSSNQASSACPYPRTRQTGMARREPEASCVGQKAILIAVIDAATPIIKAKLEPMEGLPRWGWMWCLRCFGPPERRI